MANQLKLAERLGLKVLRPPIRQSNAEDRDHCPAYFMWRHRFGLVRKGLAPSRGLTVGSFFHDLMDANVRGVFEPEALAGCAARIADVSNQLQSDDMPFTEAQAAIDNMQKALSLSRVMAEIAYMQYPLDPKYSVLYTEHQVQVRPEWMYYWPITGTLDRIVSEKMPDGSVQYWVLDYKTTSKSPKLRAQTCMREWQTDTYWLLATETLRTARLDSSKLAGIIHWIIQVPGITLGQNDRDFEDVNRIFKSGPRKGQTVMKRMWHGEPKWENYYRRASQWYTGTGLCEDRAKTVIENPPIIQSFSRYAGNPFVSRMRRCELRSLYRDCTREPNLVAFPIRMSARKCSSYGACPFMRLCQADCSIHREVIAAHYRQLEPKTSESIDTPKGTDNAQPD